MDVPGGVVKRPFTKIYDPTFWPAISFVHLKDHTSGRGMGIFPGGPASVSGNSNGAVEWIGLRNAPREKAFGFLPLLAHPASGTASEEFTFEYAVLFTPKGDWREDRLYSLAQEVLSEAWIMPDTPDVKETADSFVTVDREDVLVTALKKASRGKGLIARLLCYSEVPCEAKLTCRDRLIKKAVVCDARERDKEDVEVESGEALLSIKTPITSVRLLF
jgi:alpha-mannosidase